MGAAEEADYKKIKNKLRAEAIEKREEFQTRIDSQGGVFLLKGLYHGERRVRAKDDDYSGWVIRDDEVDLISAIGRKTVKGNANPVDLKNKWGLKERKEYAPVKAVIDGDYARIIRTDEWGEAGELANLSFKERVKLAIPSSMGELLYMLIFPHLVLAIIAMEYTSTLTRLVIGSTGILILFLISTIFTEDVLPTIFPGLDLGNSLSMVLTLLIVLYASLPFFGFLISSHSDNPSSK